MIESIFAYVYQLFSVIIDNKRNCYHKKEKKELNLMKTEKQKHGKE